MVLTVYHDLNKCFYGRQIFLFLNLIRIKVATIVTDFDNEQKCTSAS